MYGHKAVLGPSSTLKFTIFVSHVILFHAMACYICLRHVYVMLMLCYVMFMLCYVV